MSAHVVIEAKVQMGGAMYMLSGDMLTIESCRLDRVEQTRMKVPLAMLKNAIEELEKAIARIHVEDLPEHA